MVINEITIIVVFKQSHYYRVCLDHTILLNMMNLFEIGCALMFRSLIFVQMHIPHLKWNTIELSKHKVNHILSQIKYNKINQI